MGLPFPDQEIIQWFSFGFGTANYSTIFFKVRYSLISFCHLTFGLGKVSTYQNCLALFIDLLNCIFMFAIGLFSNMNISGP